MSNGDLWNGRCTLITETAPLDELRRPQKVLTDLRTVFCKVAGVNQKEFYQAAQQGYKVEKQLEIRRASYSPNATHIRHNGCVYRILRTYQPKNADNIGLICVDKANETGENG